MRKILLVLILTSLTFSASAYEKLSLVERFTNASCGPCADLNAAWYTATTHKLC